MNKFIKITALVSASAMLVGMAAGCGSNNQASSQNGHVYYLSEKPEQQEQFKKIAKEFTAETKIPVDISVAAAGTAEQTLKSELAKSSAPTLFDVGDGDQKLWGSYMDDMSHTNEYKDLQKSEYAMREKGRVIGVPYVMERYGIIYNKALLKKYFDASWSSIKSIDKVNNFKALKTVADEIQAHKSDIGVNGAFTSAGFDPSSSRRYGAQLAQIPVYYEYRDRRLTDMPATITNKYVSNLKNIFDLYITDSTTPRTQLSGKTMDDSNSEFSLGQAVFLQNGTWGYPQIRDQKVADEDMGVLPIYTGVKGEEKQGLTVSFMFWALNKNSSKKDREATLKFLDFILKNDKARKIVTDEMSFETPFKSYAKAGFKTKNPIHRANDAYAKAGDYDTAIYPEPTQQWMDTLSGDLLAYAQQTGDWSKVEHDYVNGWASEYKTTHNK